MGSDVPNGTIVDKQMEFSSRDGRRTGGAAGTAAVRGEGSRDGRRTGRGGLTDGGQAL